MFDLFILLINLIIISWIYSFYFKFTHRKRIIFCCWIHMNLISGIISSFFFINPLCLIGGYGCLINCCLWIIWFSLYENSCLRCLRLDIDRLFHSHLFIFQFSVFQFSVWNCCLVFFFLLACNLQLRIGKYRSATQFYWING